MLGADDKVGLAAAIEAVRASGRERRGRTPRSRSSSPCRRRSAFTAPSTCAPSDAACDLCLVLDADGTPGGIVVGAPTHYTFTAEFIGRAAHAGVAARAGHLARSRMAADAIDRMELGRLDDAHDGERRLDSRRTARPTSSPLAATLTGECRSLDRERVEAVREAMDSALTRRCRASTAAASRSTGPASTRASQRARTTRRCGSCRPRARMRASTPRLYTHRRRLRRQRARGDGRADTLALALRHERRAQHRRAARRSPTWTRSRDAACSRSRDAWPAGDVR